MKRYYIVQGDVTTHGGFVTGGVETDTINDIPMATQGTAGYCPRCKEQFVIVEGLPDDIAPNGQGFAVEGMLVSCGAFLIAGRQKLAYYENDSAEYSGHPVIEETRNATNESESQQHGKQFLVTNSETGEPLANRKFIAIVDGVKKECMTDSEGYARINAESQQSIDFHLIFEAPAGLFMQNSGN